MYKRTVAIGLSTLALMFVNSARAEEKSPKKPLGAWTRTSGDQKITFDFKSDALLVTIAAGNETIKVDADYGVTKDGRVFGIITKVTKPGEGGPSEGDLFSFKFTAVDNKMTIEDLKGTKHSGEAEQLVHGEYEKEKKDN
ncbi:MAG: hypothetical protein ACJ8FY_02540 [Gemmataceae bacterium]